MKKVILFLLTALFAVGCAQIVVPIILPTEEIPTAQSESVEIFFVMDTPKGFRLFKERHSKVSTESESFQALDALLSGVKPLDADYVNLWSNGAKINSFAVIAGTAFVDLANWELNVGSEAEARAIDQIVYTLIANNQNIQNVLITKNGKSIDSLAGHLDASSFFSAENPVDSLAGVDIDLEQGATLEGTIEINGKACTFEATVAWELRQGENLVDSGSTTATSACPDFGNWKVSLGNLNPGNYNFRVWESSAKDGSILVEDDKDFTVAR